MTLLCGELDDVAVFMPFVERTIAAPDSGSADWDRHERLHISPPNADAIAANVELWNLTDMHGQGHTRLPKDSARLAILFPNLSEQPSSLTTFSTRARE